MNKLFSREQMNILYQYCFSLTADETQSYDLLQAGLEKYLRADVNHVNNKIAYVRKVIRNHYIDECRRNYNLELEEFDDSVAYLDAGTDSLETIAATRCQLEAVWAKLTTTEREIMYLWAIEGYTVNELAEFMGIPKGTLLSKIHRLRKRLVDLFKPSNKQGVL